MKFLISPGIPEEKMINLLRYCEEIVCSAQAIAEKPPLTDPPEISAWKFRPTDHRTIAANTVICGTHTIDSPVYIDVRCAVQSTEDSCVPFLPLYRTTEALESRFCHTNLPSERTCSPLVAGLSSDCGRANVGQRLHRAGNLQDSKAILKGLSYEKCTLEGM